MSAEFAPDDACVFCQPNNNTVWSDKDFAICSDPAPLAEGHMLLYSKQHYPSAADVSTEDAQVLDYLCDDLGRRFQEKYGEYFTFEHGRTGHCIRSSAGERMCHHLHIHFISAKLDPASLLPTGQHAAVESWEEVADIGAETDGYLVAGGNADGLVFMPIAVDLPPHFLRTEIAEELDVPERADWENFVTRPEAAEVADDAHSEAERLVAGLTIPDDLK